jgi:hypothetical protein
MADAQPLDDATLAERIVENILDDLTDRRGLKHEWYQIDEDIRAEIIEKWQAIVRAALQGEKTDA